jgi:predicted Zn-dependent peptidase
MMTNTSAKWPHNAEETQTVPGSKPYFEARSVLSNGLTVVSATLEHLHTVAVSVFAPGGPRYERAEDNGLSHLVEHGLFRGCEAFPSARAFNEAVESCSLGLGAATYREFVTLDALCGPDHVSKLLGLIGAMLDAPTWTDLDIEQRIIVEELQDELDEKGRDIDVDNVAKLTLMPACGAGRKIGGDIQQVKRFNAADCQRWFEACYGAQNLILSVAGPMSHDAVVAMAESSLGTLRAGAPLSPTEMSVRDDLPALEYVSHGGSQTSVQVAWLVPPPASPDWPALTAIQRLLDDGTCARLRRRITDDDGLAYHVGSSLEAFTDRALLVIEADISHDNVLAVLDAIFEEVAALASHEATSTEWSRMRQRYEFDLAVAIDGAPEVAYRIGLAAFYGRDLTIESSKARFFNLTPVDVTRVVARHLKPTGAQITVIGALDPMDRVGLRRRTHRLRGANDGATRALE